MIRLSMITIAIIGVFGGIFVQASTIHQQYDTFAKDIMMGLSSDTQSLGRRGVIEKMCNVFLANRYLQMDAQTSFVMTHYDASQSVFLYQLCTHAGVEPAKFLPSLAKHYTKTNDLNNMGILCRNDNAKVPSPRGCVPGCKENKYQMNTCNMAFLSEKIFTILQNDISNMALAHAYGLVIGTNNDSKKIDEIVNELYFKRSDSMLYSDRFPEFPKTHKYLKSFVNNSKELMKKPIMLDALKIQTLGEQKKNTDCTLNVLLTKEGLIDTEKVFDMWGCMYSPAQVFSQAQGEQAIMVNIMYNELFWYKMFAQYYGFVLSSDLTLSQTDKTDNAARQIQQIAFEAQQASADTQKAGALIQDVIRTVNTVKYTFPLHIGLMAYHESLLSFRDTLATLYTPFSQLGYKLRNAQAKTY